MRLGKAGWWIIPPCLPWLLSEDGAWGHSQIMQWSHPKSCMLKVLSAVSSAVPAEGGNTRAALCISHCKASCRENSWQEPSVGFSCRAGAPWKIPIPAVPPNPTLLLPQPKQPQGILTHAKSAFSTKPNWQQLLLRRSLQWKTELNHLKGLLQLEWFFWLI